MLKNLLIPPANRAAQQAESSVYIYGPIGRYDDMGEISSTSVRNALSQISGRPTLNVYVNSVGGSVFEGMAIYHEFRRFKGKKIFHIDSVAASIASVLSMAADEIHMGFNAQMMIHDPEGTFGGREDDVRRGADLLARTKQTIVDTYVARTKQSRSTISAWMGAETWFNAKEALKHGFVDRVVNADGGSEIDDRSRIILAKYKHTPKDIAPSAELVSRAMVAKMKMVAMRNRIGGTSA